MSESPATAAPRLCTTCTHYRKDWWMQWCARDVTLSPVDGKASTSHYSCSADRMATRYDPSLAYCVGRDPCGPEGKHWAVRRADQSFMDRVEAGDPDAVALFRPRRRWWHRLTRAFTSSS